LIAESQSVEMPITKSDYQSLTLRIKKLEERIAELEKDNAEKTKIIAEQAKIIEELKAKLARYENPHTPPSTQRFKENSKSKKSKNVEIQPPWCSS